MAGLIINSIINLRAFANYSVIVFDLLNVCSKKSYVLISLKTLSHSRTKTKSSALSLSLFYHKSVLKS